MPVTGDTLKFGKSDRWGRSVRHMLTSPPTHGTGVI
jgi:hypothetical protein